LSYQTQHSIVNMQVSGIFDLLPQAIGIIGALPGQRDRSRPKHDVTAGFMMLADDMRPDATLLIGLSTYSLQHQTHILYELTRHDLRWHTIGWLPIKSMMQVRKAKRWGINCDNHCRPGSAGVPTINANGLRDV